MKKPIRILQNTRLFEAQRVVRLEKRDLKHRFIIVGDMHRDLINTSSTSKVGVDDRTGSPTTPRPYNERYSLLLNSLVKEKQKGLDFVVFNGDLIHSNQSIQTLESVKNEFDSKLNIPLYATLGNHDRINNSNWNNVFGHNQNHYFSVGDFGYILLNSSNENGDRQVCEGYDFLANAFEQLKTKKGVFVITHIPRYAGVRNNSSYDSPECTDILNLFKNQSNLISVTNSHFHEEDRIFKKNNHDVWFTGHFAHYGLNYYGYRVVEIDKNNNVYTSIFDVSNQFNKNEKSYRL